MNMGNIEQLKASIMNSLLPMVKDMDESVIERTINDMKNLSPDFKKKVLNELLEYKRRQK